MQWEFSDHDPGDTEGSFLLVAVPVTRNVAAIVSSALLRAKGRRLVATIQSDAMPPVSMAYQGVVSGPMHIWAIPGPAGPGRRSRELLVLASDIRLTPEALMSFAGATARWAREKGIAHAIAIEGADANEFPPEPTMATTHAGEGKFDELKLARYEGVHAGMVAAFLARFNQHKIPAAGIFTATPGDILGDTQAAVNAIQALAPVLPKGFAQNGIEEMLAGLAEAVQNAQAEQSDAGRELARQSRHDPGYA